MASKRKKKKETNKHKLLNRALDSVMDEQDEHKDSTTSRSSSASSGSPTTNASSIVVSRIESKTEIAASAKKFTDPLLRLDSDDEDYYEYSQRSRVSYSETRSTRSQPTESKVAKLDLVWLEQLTGQSKGDLVEFEELWLDGGGLKGPLPESLSMLPSLQFLVLSNNNLERIDHKATHKWNNIRVLILSHNQITSISEGALDPMTALQELYIGHNRLYHIPASGLGKLQDLRLLHMPNNQLTSLPMSIGHLTSMRSANLSRNKLQRLPESISRLLHLRSLDLSHNHLMSLPDGICYLNSLRDLRLSNNRLVNVPESIIRLIHIQYLDLSHNKLVTLPYSIHQMIDLESLLLSNNNLTALPFSMHRMKRLDMLTLDSNPLVIPPIKFTKEGTAALKRYLADQEELSASSSSSVLPKPSTSSPTTIQTHPISQKAPHLQARVVIMGSMGTGKSLLARSLLIKPVLFWPDLLGEDKTLPGQTCRLEISNTPLSFKLSNGTELEATLWEFPGLREIRASIGLFAAHGAVHIVTWNILIGPRKSKIGLWLGLLANVVPGSRVILVGTSLDTVPGSYGLQRWGEELERIVSPFDKSLRISKNRSRISCRTGDGVESLREEVNDMLMTLPFVASPLPPSVPFVASLVFQLRSQRSVRWARIDEFYHAAIHMGFSPQVVDNALIFLHNQGTIVWSPAPMIRTLIVLDPVLLSKAVRLISATRAHVLLHGAILRDDIFPMASEYLNTENAMATPQSATSKQKRAPNYHDCEDVLGHYEETMKKSPNSKRPATTDTVALYEPDTWEDVDSFVQLLQHYQLAFPHGNNMQVFPTNLAPHLPPLHLWDFSPTFQWNQQHIVVFRYSTIPSDLFAKVMSSFQELAFRNKGHLSFFSASHFIFTSASLNPIITANSQLVSKPQLVSILANLDPLAGRMTMRIRLAPQNTENPNSFQKIDQILPILLEPLNVIHASYIGIECEPSLVCPLCSAHSCPETAHPFSYQTIMEMQSAGDQENFATCHRGHMLSKNDLLSGFRFKGHLDSLAAPLKRSHIPSVPPVSTLFLPLRIDSTIWLFPLCESPTGPHLIGNNRIFLPDEKWPAFRTLYYHRLLYVVPYLLLFAASSSPQNLPVDTDSFLHYTQPGVSVNRSHSENDIPSTLSGAIHTTSEGGPSRQSRSNSNISKLASTFDDGVCITETASKAADQLHANRTDLKHLFLSANIHSIHDFEQMLNLGFDGQDPPPFVQQVSSYDVRDFVDTDEFDQSCHLEYAHMFSGHARWVCPYHAKIYRL